MRPENNWQTEYANDYWLLGCDTPVQCSQLLEASLNLWVSLGTDFLTSVESLSLFACQISLSGGCILFFTYRMRI